MYYAGEFAMIGWVKKKKYNNLVTRGTIRRRGSNAFTKVVKVLDHNEVSNVGLTWYSPRAIHQIDLVGRVFANVPGDLGSFVIRVIPKTLKMVLDTSLLNTQQNEVRIKGKVEQSRKRSSALCNTSV